MRALGTVILVLGGWAGIIAPALAQSPLDHSVNEATKVLREIMAVPLRCIPASLLHEAQGIAIVPGLVKGGLIIGMEHGKGVFVIREERGLWRAPVFITVTGGSLGAQVGVQSTDLVLVFKTKRSVDGVLRGKVVLGTDLAVAAGPLGRDASASSDGQFRAEILSYSRSRGLFAGLAIDGATIHIDHRANAEFYAVHPGQPQPTIPASAVALTQLVTSYAPPGRPLVEVTQPVEVKHVPPPVCAAPDECEALRQQLVAAALRLQPVLDPTWQKYLALPPEVFTGHAVIHDKAFEACLQRFQTVASDGRYRALNEHHEFQETHALLRRYASMSQPRPGGALPLPLPPGR